MIPGYNHNVKYKDVVYHVQTEDSGVQNPHFITHLFVGGNIIHSAKTSYTELLTNDDMVPAVTQLMQGQHKEMLRKLIRGELDQALAERSINVGKLDGPAPLNVSAGAQGRVSMGFGGSSAHTAAPTLLPTELPADKTTIDPPTPSVTATLTTPSPSGANSVPAALAPTLAPALAPLPVPNAYPLSAAPNPTLNNPTLNNPKPPQQTAPAKVSPFSAPISQLPRQKPPTGSIGAPTHAPVPPPVRLPPAVTVADNAGASAASFFNQNAPTTKRPPENASVDIVFDAQDEGLLDALFGADLISEKSLDEVILDYLTDTDLG